MDQIIELKNNRKLTIIEQHGYCFGVKRALNIVYETIDNKDIKRPIYLLGNLIHNKIVTNKLTELGVITIDKPLKTRLELLDEIDCGTVIFSAHGVSRAVYKKANDKGLNIIDASCKMVKLIHTKVINYTNNGYQIIYIGKKNHPECEAILQEGKNIYLVSNKTDLDNLNILNDKIYVTNQTTLSSLETKELYDLIQKKYPNAIIDNKICNATTIRQTALLNQTNSDFIIIVGDKLSSNTKSLLEIAKTNLGKDAILIETFRDLENIDLNKYQHISITSGASCPEEIFNSIVDYIKNKD